MKKLNTQLARVVRNSLGRFVKIETLASCSDEACDIFDAIEDEQEKLQGALTETDTFLESLEAIALEDDPETQDALVEIIHSYRLYLREDLEKIEAQLGRSKASEISKEFDKTEEGKAQGKYAFVTSSEVDVMDITGISGKDAQRLALKLRFWNPNASQVYVKRSVGGSKVSRYVHPNIKRINLNDPVIKELGLDDDLWSIVKERNLPIDYEAWTNKRAKAETKKAAKKPVLKQETAKKAKRIDSKELSRQGRVQKQSLNTQEGLPILPDEKIGDATQKALIV